MMDIKKITKTITLERVILGLAAGFAAYNFGLAGGYIEGHHLSIGGVLAGVTFNVSLAVAASRLGSLSGHKRVRQALISFAVMMLLSPVIVAPVIYASLPETFLGWSPLRALWAIAWALVPDLAIVLAGAVTGKSLIALSAPQAANPAEQPANLRRRSANSTAQTSQAAKLYECNWPGCEWSTVQSVAVQRGGDPQAALAAHMSHHNRKAVMILAEKAQHVTND